MTTGPGLHLVDVDLSRLPSVRLFTRIEGLDEVLKKVLTLDEKIQRNIIRKSVYAGAKIMRDAVQAAAPVSAEPHRRGGRLVQPGTLKRAVLTKWARELSDGWQQSYVVTLRTGKKYQSMGKKGVDKDAYYWTWVEYGHKLVLRRGKAGGSITSRRRSAPQMVKPHPFFVPAYDRTLPQTESAMQQRMTQLLNEALNER